MATYVLNYSQVTLAALEMTHFPSVNIALFEQFIILQVSTLEVVVGILMT